MTENETPEDSENQEHRIDLQTTLRHLENLGYEGIKNSDEANSVVALAEGGLAVQGVFLELKSMKHTTCAQKLDGKVTKCIQDLAANFPDTTELLHEFQKSREHPNWVLDSANVAAVVGLSKIKNHARAIYELQLMSVYLGDLVYQRANNEKMVGSVGLLEGDDFFITATKLKEHLGANYETDDRNLLTQQVVATAELAKLGPWKVAAIARTLAVGGYVVGSKEEPMESGLTWVDDSQEHNTRTGFIQPYDSEAITKMAQYIEADPLEELPKVQIPGWDDMTDAMHPPRMQDTFLEVPDGLSKLIGSDRDNSEESAEK